MIPTIVLFMIVIALSGILLWAGLCAVWILYQSNQAKKHDQRYTCGGTIAGFTVTGLIGQAIYWVAAWAILQGVASGMVMLMQSQAQTVYHAAASYTEKSGEKLHTVIGSNRNGSTYAYDSLEAEIIRQLPNEQGIWFAVVADKNGNVVAAYVSHHELTRSELRPMDVQEQQKMLLNPKQGENAVISSWTAAQQHLQERRDGMGDAD